MCLNDLRNIALKKTIGNCMVRESANLPFVVPDKFVFAAAVVLKAPKNVVAKVLRDNKIPFQARWTKAHLVELLFNSM